MSPAIAEMEYQRRESAAHDDALYVEQRVDEILSDKEAIGELTEAIYSNGCDDSFHCALIDAMNGDNTMLNQLLYDTAKAKAEKEEVNSDDYCSAA